MSKYRTASQVSVTITVDLGSKPYGAHPIAFGTASDAIKEIVRSSDLHTALLIAMTQDDPHHMNARPANPTTRKGAHRAAEITATITTRTVKES